jgi:hypothetical protein
MDFLVVNHLKVRVNNIIHFPNAFKKSLVEVDFKKNMIAPNIALLGFRPDLQLRCLAAAF